jgi:hypothetical protein
LSDIPLRVSRELSPPRQRPRTEGKLWTPRLERAVASVTATDQPKPQGAPRTLGRLRPPQHARLHFGGDRLARYETVPHFGAGPPQSAAKTDAADLPSGKPVSHRRLRPPTARRTTPASDDLVNPMAGLELAPPPISGSTENLPGGRLFGDDHTGSQSMCQVRSTPPKLPALCPAHSADNPGTSTGTPTTSCCGNTL